MGYATRFHLFAASTILSSSFCVYSLVLIFVYEVGKMNKIFLWAITSALAGFLFGFDTVVISGAESKIQNLWSLSGAMHGLAISSALWGTVLGALIGSIPTNKFGRKKTLIFNGILFFVSAVGSAFAWDVWSFSFFRFIGGVGIGISTISAPLFIAEISPAKNRGKLTALFQFNIVLGILIAFVSNGIVQYLASDVSAWRWMLGVEAIPALAYTLMCLTLSESPRYLITIAHKEAEGRQVFKIINPEMTDKELDVLVQEVKESAVADSKNKGVSELFTKKLIYPVIFAFLIAAFNQLSGINIILYFAPRLLALAGIEDAVTASISLGVANLIFTYVGVRFIDVLGRRTLLILGCIGYIISLSICTYAFVHFNELKVVSASIDAISSSQQVIQMETSTDYMTEEDRQIKLNNYETAKAKLVEISNSNEYNTTAKVDASFDPNQVLATANEIKAEASEQLGMVSSTVLICMILFIASHALGSGTIIWVFCSEIFPPLYRAAGQSVGSFSHWIFAAGLTLVFPIVIAAYDASVMFGFFTLMMIIQLLFAIFIMPETKGRTLEELSENLMGGKKAKA